MSKILRLQMVSAQRKNKGKNKRIENNEPPTSAIPGAHPARSLRRPKLLSHQYSGKRYQQAKTKPNTGINHIFKGRLISSII